MRLLLASLFALLFVSTVVAEPVNDLVARLSADHGWSNGVFPILGLPKDASAEQVAGKVFNIVTFASGRVRRFSIVSQREVRLSGALPDTYTAILVLTDLGAKIVLLQYHEPPLGWWSRVYDVPPA